MLMNTKQSQPLGRYLWDALKTQKSVGSGGKDDATMEKSAGLHTVSTKMRLIMRTGVDQIQGRVAELD